MFKCTLKYFKVQPSLTRTSHFTDLELFYYFTTTTTTTYGTRICYELFSFQHLDNNEYVSLSVCLSVSVSVPVSVSVLVPVCVCYPAVTLLSVL